MPISSGVVIEQPALILVGAQKAATTWFAKGLMQDEAFAFSFLKEVHYFDMLDADGKLIERIRDRVRKRALERADRASRDNSAWRDYLLSAADLQTMGTDEWYARLFTSKPSIRRRLASGGDTVFCDFTPAYMTLSRKHFQHMKRLLPAANYLLVVRDPVQRMRSGFSMALELDPALRGLETGDRLTALENNQLARGDYRRVITMFEELDMPLTTVAFRDLTERPGTVKRRLEGLFGLASFEPEWPRSRTMNSHSGRHPLEPDLVEHMRELCAPQYDFLAERFGPAFLERL